jgi:hypothetical protein
MVAYVQWRRHGLPETTRRGRQWVRDPQKYKIGILKYLWVPSDWIQFMAVNNTTLTGSLSRDLHVPLLTVQKATGYRVRKERALGQPFVCTYERLHS